MTSAELMAIEEAARIKASEACHEHPVEPEQLRGLRGQPPVKVPLRAGVARLPIARGQGEVPVECAMTTDVEDAWADLRESPPPAPDPTVESRLGELLRALETVCEVQRTPYAPPTFDLVVHVSETRSYRVHDRKSLADALAALTSIVTGHVQTAYWEASEAATLAQGAADTAASELDRIRALMRGANIEIAHEPDDDLPF